jgi:cyanophycinase
MQAESPEAHPADPATYGHLLAIGGAESKHCRGTILTTFVELAGGPGARILLSTTATTLPEAARADYVGLLGNLGAESVRELRIVTRADADDERNLTLLREATAVLFTGGDQARFGALVRSRAHALLRTRLAQDALVVAGTSAGATALGDTMILGTGNRDPTELRMAPGLALVPDAVVDMHFAQRGRLPRLVRAVCAAPHLLGLGIDEDTAVLIRGGRFDVLGTGAVTIVDARQATVCRPPEHGEPAHVLDLRLHALRAGNSFDLERRRPIHPTRHSPQRTHDAH